MATTSVARHHHTIVTIFGLYGRDDEGILPIATLIRLMGELGVEPAGVRSSVSRLKKRGVLESTMFGASAAYRLAPHLDEVFREGDARIFSHRHNAEEAWGLVAVSVPETERTKRHQVRTLLTQLGFGTVIPGLWIAPAGVVEHAQRRLDRAGLDGYADFFTAEYIARDRLREKIADWWDLEALAATYSDFVRRFEPLGKVWLNGGKTPDVTASEPSRDRRAFADYIPLLTVWRRLPYLDPGLPREFLPHGWVGYSAEDLFDALHETLSEPARRHAHKVLAGAAN